MCVFTNDERLCSVGQIGAEPSMLGVSYHRVGHGSGSVEQVGLVVGSRFFLTYWVRSGRVQLCGHVWVTWMIQNVMSNSVNC